MMLFVYHDVKHDLIDLLPVLFGSNVVIGISWVGGKFKKKLNFRNVNVQKPKKSKLYSDHYSVCKI